MNQRTAKLINRWCGIMDPASRRRGIKAMKKVWNRMTPAGRARERKFLGAQLENSRIGRAGVEQEKTEGTEKA